VTGFLRGSSVLESVEDWVGRHRRCCASPGASVAQHRPTRDVLGWATIEGARSLPRRTSGLELLVSVVGASSFATANPMQRIWRDLETASRHGSINPLLASEDLGCVLVGIDTPVTVF
jgi:hypothetical protein